MNKHQKYLFIILVVCCSLSIIRRLFTEGYKEGETEDTEETDGKVREGMEGQDKTGEVRDEMKPPEKIDCMGRYEDPQCPEFCGFQGGKIVNKWITEIAPLNGGAACPSDAEKECPATDPCPIDCEGYYNEYPQCPTYCGYEGGTVTRKWVTTQEPLYGGKACPGDKEVTCPASESCLSVQNVMTY